MFNFHSRKPAKRPHHLRLSPIRQKCQTWTQRNGQSDGVYVKLTARSTQSSPLPGPSVRRLWNTALEVKSRTTPGTTEVTFLLNYQEFAPFCQSRPGRRTGPSWLWRRRLTGVIFGECFGPPLLAIGASESKLVAHAEIDHGGATTTAKRSMATAIGDI